MGEKDSRLVVLHVEPAFSLASQREAVRWSLALRVVPVVGKSLSGRYAGRRITPVQS